MGKKIRVVETRIFEYIPDIQDLSYADQDCRTVEEAMAIDERDVKKREIDLLELDEQPIIERAWFIVNDNE